MKKNYKSKSRKGQSEDFLRKQDEDGGLKTVNKRKTLSKVLI